MFEIKVQRIYKIEGNETLKAFIDISINDAILIKELKIVNGQHGLFVSMPSEQAKDKKWYESVKALTDEVRDEITAKVLEAYNSCVNGEGFHGV